MSESNKPGGWLTKIRTQITSVHISLLSLLVLVLFINGLLVSLAMGSGKYGIILGGPDDALTVNNSLGNQSIELKAVSPLRDVFSGDENNNIVLEDDALSVYIVKSATLSNDGAVLSGSVDKQNGNILTYKVQENDTLSKIAEKFGVSLNTILWANNKTKNNKLNKGDELTILPVSGVLYEVKTADTLASLSASFGVPSAEIAKINDLEVVGTLTPGEKLVIPNGKPLRSLSAIASESHNNLPAISGFFAFPAPRNSYNWGILHNNNAVDIANVCGTSIYAAAAGVVTKTGSPASWNSGYGGYIALEHQNGAETLYAHTETNLVDIGSFVNQGDTIAKMGETGKATGCHVHFEVHGARNPFAK